MHSATDQEKFFNKKCKKCHLGISYPDWVQQRMRASTVHKCPKGTPNGENGQEVRMPIPPHHKGRGQNIM